MNRKKIILTLAAICGGIILPGAIRVMADADDAPATEEKVATIVSVQTGKITSATLHGYVQGFGTIEPAPATPDQPAASAQLSAPSAGIVAKVNVVEGQQVTNGEVLVDLSSPALRAEVERQKKLYAQQNTSLKNLQDAQAQLDLLLVTAPLSGTVVRVNVKPGQAVDLTTVVAEVMDLNRLAVSAEIPSAEANDLKSGDRARSVDRAAGDDGNFICQPEREQGQRHGSGARVVAEGQRVAARTICFAAHRDGGSHELSRRAD